MRAPIVLAERRQHRREARLLELQRLQFLHDGLVELARGLAPLRRYRIGGLHIGLARGFRRPRQAFERAAAIVERRQLRRDVAAQGRQAVDRHIVLARERPERKEALLALLQAARIAAERASLRLDLGYRFARLERRALQRRRRRVQPAGGLVLEPLDMPQRGAERALSAALRHVERLKDKAAGRLDAAAAALERAALEAREAISEIETQGRTLGGDASSLEKSEERLFALRALARKHNVAVDGLAALRRDIAAKLAALDDGGGALEGLTRAAEAARQAYMKAADAVSAERRQAAGKLDQAVMKELKPLKLEKARFTTMLTALGEDDWGPHGRELVHFEVATNPGAPAGPLAKVASGGELSRFMLALKVVLARTSPVPTLVFDEVDSGIGGAVAAAVGDRLHRLGQELQVLVVTHSPQVAARGSHHWRVEKSQAAQQTLTRVEELSIEARTEEIARMLSGAAITAEARAAAASLMAGARA